MQADLLAAGLRSVPALEVGAGIDLVGLVAALRMGPELPLEVAVAPVAVLEAEAVPRGWAQALGRSGAAEEACPSAATG